MIHRSRRSLLQLIGTGTVTLMAGCQTGASPGTPSRSETAAGTTDGTDPETEIPTEANESESVCGLIPRPEATCPVPRQSPAQDGFAAEHERFETAPTVGWEAEPSTHDEENVSPNYGRPVVATSTVFLTNLLNRGPERPEYGYVHALDTDEGDRQWTSERLLSPSHPVVLDTLVIVVAETESHNTVVVAFDATDGTRRWTRKFAAHGGGFVATGNRLFLALEEESDRGTVRALAADGTTAWSREGAFPDHVTQGPVVGTDTVYVTTHDGQLFALDRTTGTTTWTHRFQHPDEKSPFVTDLVVTDCHLITVVEGMIKVLDHSGVLVWEESGDHGPTATDGETVYASADRGDGERALRALSVSSGDTRWTVQGPVETFEPPIITDDVVYVRFDESIRALDPADGTEYWQSDSHLGDLALADETLYGTTRGTLRALR